MERYGANALYRELKHATAILRVAAAENRLALIMARLRLHLKAGFDPNQPREPAGQPTGGRWTRVDVAQIGSTRHPSFYYFDLRAIDSKREHAWRKHVNKTPIQLMITLLESIRLGVQDDGSPAMFHHPAEGTFLSEGEANNLVAAALRANPLLVERAVAGDNRVKIIHDFSFQTGIEAYLKDWDSVPIIRPTTRITVLLGHDPKPGSRGYTVITAFPMNDIPNEVHRDDPDYSPPGIL